MENAKSLFARVVVRRVGTGAASFGWEIHGEDPFKPSYVSPDKFANMEAAYRAGQARLAEFDKPTRMPEVTKNTRWRSRQISQDYYRAAAAG